MTPDVGHFVCGCSGVLLLNSEITKFDVMSVKKKVVGAGGLCVLVKCFLYAFSSMQIPSGSCCILDKEGEEIQTVARHLLENTNLHLFSILI